MIQLALSLLLASQVLLSTLLGIKDPKPELVSQVNQIIALATQTAQEALATSSTTPVFAPQDAPGEVFSPNEASSSVSGIVPASTGIPLAFTVQPFKTLVSTSTGPNMPIFDENYNLHFETNYPVSGQFFVPGLGDEGDFTATTSVDLPFINQWGRQFPYSITASDGVTTLTATGKI